MSKVRKISLLRLSVYVKILHFGLNQENRIPEKEGSGRNIFITKFYARPNCRRNLQVLPVSKTSLCQQNMASCEYGQIAGGTCGPSVDNPANVKSIVLAECTKAIQGHLCAYNARDATLV